MNVAKDDALAYPTVVHREYPRTVNARMEGTIRPFIQKSLDVNLTLLAVFNERLGLPEGTLAKCHLMDEHSACESRVIKNPPKPGEMPEDKAAIGAHTDFGSLVGSTCSSLVQGHEFDDTHVSRSCTTGWADCK